MDKRAAYSRVKQRIKVATCARWCRIAKGALHRKQRFPLCIKSSALSCDYSRLFKMILITYYESTTVTVIWVPVEPIV